MSTGLVLMCRHAQGEGEYKNTQRWGELACATMFGEDRDKLESYAVFNIFYFICHPPMCSMAA